ncbi:MAG: SelB C-terminal domain-containing protein, partial [Halomonas sp.]|nr:SelB C-terminal domain-containing protein [Halomonas sp.]
LGDRFVIRDHGGHVTLGGGIVLDGNPPRRGQRAPQRLAWLKALAEAAAGPAPLDMRHPLEAGLALWPAGLDLAEMARNANLQQATLVDQVAVLNGETVTVQDQARAFSRQAVESLGARVIETLAANHEREPSMLGTERERLRRQVMPSLPGPFFRPLLEQLIDTGRVRQQGPFVALPNHQATLDAVDEALWQRLCPLIAARPFEPPRVRDMAASEALDEQRVRTALTACARLGRVYQVRKDHFFLAAAIHEMAAIVQDLADTGGAARAAEFRDRIGTGRKLAIQILEFFDRLGFTRRIRDDHVVRRTDMWS